MLINYFACQIYFTTSIFFKQIACYIQLQCHKMADDDMNSGESVSFKESEGQQLQEKDQVAHFYLLFCIYMYSV